MLPNIEATIRAKAEALGLALPSFAMARYPQVFAQWADRVAQADMLRARGKLTAADLDECDRSIGIKASRAMQAVVPSSIVGAFRVDSLCGVRFAVRQFSAEDAR